MLETLKNLPDKPGVYQYFDKDGKLLYVGKAKSLKKRVKSYFRFTPKLSPAPNLSPRIYNMVSQIVRIETIVTNSESDALLLENSLIKQLRPKYNILLRDDKTYPYLYIDLSEPFARLELTRKVVKGNKIKYFGPFPTGANAILASIYELVPLVQKKSCLKEKKACLFHQIKRCMAPCEGKITQIEYSQLIDEAIGYIHNKKALLDALRNRMEKYAEQLRFEEAAQIRDRIEAIKKIEDVNTVDLAKLENLDIFTVAFDETRGVVVRLFMREGKIVSSSHTYIDGELKIENGEFIEEIYRRTILEFYLQDTPFVAKKILVSHDLSDKNELETILYERFGKKIEILYPKRGEKKRLINLGLQNAVELLRQKQDIPQSNILERIRTLLNLSDKPTRIEVFDNSHLMGTAVVGAMVVYDNEKWDKASYRHYNLNAKDEYHQMQEMLTRRIESFNKIPPPDLWVIDGGETLRALAETLLKKASVNLTVVGIAKEKIDAKAHRARGSAKDILYTEVGELKLQPTDTRLQWFQKLRDEAHRFAISFHKKQRLKKEKSISLLKVNGIGQAKVKRLLDFFGTFEEIKKADFETLRNTLSAKDANAIIEFFNSNKAY